MKNKRKGFTLIELLAVIVILGLLMAIAIPSVTKYITESRKKTVVSTIGNYITAAVNEVNDLTYTFTGDNMIYAVPIECIPLERGGTNPFGEWHQSNDAYFAYVLVQYDDETSSYKYGYTFKDSAGYGLYPTTQANIDESGKQIQTGLELNQPKSGNISNVASLDVWKKSGFEVSDTTQLKVLVAESEGNIGDGVNTCTLCQKGDNYTQVENNKDNDKTEVELPMLNSLTSIMANNDIPYFYPYIEQIKSITFENKINIPSGSQTYDFSSTKNGKVISFIRNHPTEVGYYDLVIQGDGKIYANPDSSYLFSIFSSVNKINNIELLNTSRVTNMKGMFSYVPINNLNLSSWDTRNVTNMSEMFKSVGKEGVVILKLGFDTSNVTDMSHMFDYVDDIDGIKKIHKIDLGDKFDTSKVTDMSSMFSGIGMFDEDFVLDLGDKFDTRNVTDFSKMFFSCPELKSITLENLDTVAAISMNSMFKGCKELEYLDISTFKFKNVKCMESMFKDCEKIKTTGFEHCNVVELLNNKEYILNCSHMFENCKKLKGFTVDFLEYFVNNLFNTYCMFTGTPYEKSFVRLTENNRA